MRKKSSLEMIYQVNLRSNVLDLICITLVTATSKRVTVSVTQ